MNENKSKKVIKNTILLYVRMAIVMVINLYVVRLVLKLLGTEDYGIYSVVAGVITMLSSITIVLSTSVQRFYSYFIGERNEKQVKQVFSCSLNIYIVFSIIVILIGETIGVWFINTHLNIPEERLIAANWVYQFSILTFVVSMFKTPFSAMTIAYEDMGVFAVITTIESLLKVIFIYFMRFAPFDKLILYGALLFMISMLDCLSYIIISKKKYDNCHYIKVKNTSLYKNILSFSGWTLYGTVAGVGMNQINTILINLFFGPIVNAARAISLQVSSAMATFTNSIVMAIRPPIIKSYAEGDVCYVQKLFNISNKIIIYLLVMVSVPLIVEMEYILNLWLGITDYQTVEFSRMIIIYSLFLALHNPITIIIQATGNIKWYSIFVESLTLACVPITYVLFKMGFTAISTYVVMIILIIVSHIVRLFCLKHELPEFSIRYYILRFLVPAMFIFALSYLAVYHIYIVMDTGIIRFLCVALSSVLIIVILSYFIALTKSEKESIIKFIRKKRFHD